MVEVADSSLSYDRGLKVRLYARANVAEYWVADVVHEQLLVHTDPQPEGYANVRALRRGDTTRPVAFPELKFEVSAILG